MSHSLPRPVGPALWACVALLLASLLVLAGVRGETLSRVGSPQAAAPTGAVSPALAALAERDPGRRVGVIVQLRSGVSLADGRTLVRANGGRVTDTLPIINGLGVRMRAGAAARLGGDPSVRAVSPNGRVRPSGDEDSLRTAFNQAIGADRVWADAGGRGIGVAVIDTGIAGGLPDFRASSTRSRVVASAVVNPDARTAEDGYGHGTHVAGLIAGDGGGYRGVAPEASLISVKISDEEGVASVLDVINGLQFVVDHKETYGIRVANLSLSSTVAESYRTDPIDAAAEQAWLNGIVVVAAAGNRGDDPNAVGYAPGNDPYVITVGATDDRGTADRDDDIVPAWSSHGRTQDGFAKPDVLAPGAHLTSTLAPGSRFAELCESCVVGRHHFRAGGTSMAAAVTSGAVAALLQAHPGWTPDQVKGALVATRRSIPGPGSLLALDRAIQADVDERVSNRGLVPNDAIDPGTGTIDYTRASWSRASWSEAPGSLQASWSRASWSCACSAGDGTSADPAASWSRASWSRASWSTSFRK